MRNVGIFNIVNDNGKLTWNINHKWRQLFYKSINAQSVTDFAGKSIYLRSIWNILNHWGMSGFSDGSVVNNLKEVKFLWWNKSKLLLPNAY